MASPMNNQPLRSDKRRGQWVSGLGWFSIGLGLAEFLMPRLLCRGIGVKPRTGLMRLLGLREIASGIGLLTQPQKEPWLKARVGGDVIDLGLLGAAFLDSESQAVPLALATTAVAGVTALDVLCHNEQSVQSRMNSADPGTAPGALRVKRSIIVNRPREEIYQLWRNFTDLPRFLQHVVSVRELADRRWHWTVQGPGGLQVEWDAELTEERPHERLAWRSLPGADVDHAGAVQFDHAPGGRGTIMRVEFTYRALAGKAGAAVAGLLGQSPQKQVGTDLLRFKQFIETGEVARTEGQPAGRARSTSRRYDDLVRA